MFPLYSKTLKKHLPAPPLPQFIEITGGYNARRQCDYGDAKQGGEHAYEAADVGNGAHVAIADGGERYGCPIQGIEKGMERMLMGIWIYVRLDIEQYECRYKDVNQCQYQNGGQHLTLLVEYGQEQAHLARYAKYLQHPCQPQQAHEAEQLEGWVEQRNGRQDGQQVYDCHKRKRIGKERRLAIVAPNVSRSPPQQVVDDEHERRAEFRVPKRPVRLHEHKRQEAYENGKNHKPVVSRAYPVGMRLSVNNVCYLLSIHIAK